DAKAELFKSEDPIGKWVKVNGIPFQVVGLYEYDSGGPEQGQRSAVYIPLKVAQQVFNAKGLLDDILFTFADASVVGAQQAQQRAVHVLARRHNFDPTDNRALWLENNVENVGKIGGVFTGITLFGWFVGIGSLFAGIVGIGNIMLIVVQERTREIGIRKALGATPGNVISQVMLESIFVTSIFGFFGLAGGILLLEGLASVVPGSAFFRDPTVDISVALKALAALIVAGALAGFFPARRAARIRPIEALRDE
ncbi:MAG: ABC transporter permease, partial [Flavobacteriales bacterium]